MFTHAYQLDQFQELYTSRDGIFLLLLEKTKLTSNKIQ